MPGRSSRGGSNGGLGAPSGQRMVRAFGNCSLWLRANPPTILLPHGSFPRITSIVFWMCLCRGANGMIYNIHALEANGRHRSARYGFRGTVKGRASSQHEYRKQPRRCGKCESLLIDLRARVMTRGRSNDCRSYFSVCKPAQFGSTAWTALPMLTDHSLHAAPMSI